MSAGQVSEELVEGGEGALITLSRSVLCLGLFGSSFLVFRVGGLTIGDGFLLGSVAVAALPLLLQRGARPPTNVLAIAAALTLVGGALATLRADSASASLLVLARVLFLVAVLPMLARRLLTSKRHIWRAAYIWSAGAALCGMGTVAQYYFGPTVIPGAEVTNVGRYPGFAQHVSDLGGITSAGAAFLLAGLSTPNQSRRAREVLLIGGCLVGLLLSGSVSGLVALAAAGVYLMLKRRISLRRAIGAGLLIAAAVSLANRIQGQTNYALSPWERALQVTGLTARDAALNTTASRLDTIEVGWTRFIDQYILIGRGLDPSSGEVVGTLTVHNVLVAAAYGGGVLFLLGFLLALGSAGRQVLRAKSALELQIGAAFVASVVFALTGPSVFNRYLWVPVALVYAVRALGRQHQPTRAFYEAEAEAEGNGRLVATNRL